MTLAIEEKPHILDIGCGVNKRTDAIGLDSNPLTNADVIHDLNDTPYPFESNYFNEVHAQHVLEHVTNPMLVMSELHRITRPGGIIHILVPHWTNPDFATDLTHRNHINSYSFRNMIEGQELFHFYTSVRYRQRYVHVSVLNLWKPLGLEWIINLDQKFPKMRFTRKFWEQYLNAVMRGKEIRFQLEVIKN